MVSNAEKLVKAYSSFVSGTESQFNDILPERNLLAAVVERAILDSNSKDRRIKTGALQWIFNSQEVTVMSFLWICSQLEWNPHEIRVGIEKINITGHKDLYYGVHYKKIRRLHG